MVYDGAIVPSRTTIPHYHGDTVRVLLICGAILILLAASIGVTLPLSTTGAVVMAVTLVVVAGITNPAQMWIHYINAFVIGINAILFGVSAIEHFRNAGTSLGASYFFIEVLALVFLIALYFAVKTIRGFVLRTQLHK